MLHSADRFGHFPIRPGESARLPLFVEDLGDTSRQYPATWDVIAFGGIVEVNGLRQCLRHCVQVRRRHDGLTRWIASHHWGMHAATFHGRGTRWFPKDAYVLDRWQRRGVGDPIWQRLCLLAQQLKLPVPVAGQNGRLSDAPLRDLAEQFSLSHTQTTMLLWYAVSTPAAEITAAKVRTVAELSEMYFAAHRTA